MTCARRVASPPDARGAARMEPLAGRSGRSTPAEYRGVESPDGATLGGRRFSRYSVGSAETYGRHSASASVASRASSGGMPSARQRRRSATDAVGSYAFVTERAQHSARVSDEEDAELARASTALLQARFQAAVATQLQFNDLVRCFPPPHPTALAPCPSRGPSMIGLLRRVF